MFPGKRVLMCFIQPAVRWNAGALENNRSFRYEGKDGQWMNKRQSSYYKDEYLNADTDFQHSTQKKEKPEAANCVERGQAHSSYQALEGREESKIYTGVTVRAEKQGEIQPDLVPGGPGAEKRKTAGENSDTRQYRQN